MLATFLNPIAHAAPFAALLILAACAPSHVDPIREPHPMTTRHATGTFDVTLKPIAPYESAPDAALGRMSIDKQFHGDLEGTSRGEMLTASGSVKGSAAYVAVERVTCTLHGRAGAFSFVHRGIMTRAVPQLLVSVVPDSGSGQLVGLSGTLAINIADGKHSFDFEYSLPETP